MSVFAIYKIILNKKVLIINEINPIKNNLGKM